jgi:hypothetical protein
MYGSVPEAVMFLAVRQWTVCVGLVLWECVEGFVGVGGGGGKGSLDEKEGGDVYQ